MLCWNEEDSCKALVSVEEIIYSHAVGTDSDNSAVRQWSGLQEHRKRFAELKATLRQETARGLHTTTHSKRAFLRLERRELCTVNHDKFSQRGWSPMPWQVLKWANNLDLILWSLKWCVLSAARLFCGCITCSWYFWEVGKL